MFAMPASIPISNTNFESAAGFWFEILARATVQSLVVLAVVGLFWLVLRRHVSHAFTHGLFLLVPARFAAVIVCGLLALELPMEIPLPFISAAATDPAGSGVIETIEPHSMPVEDHPTAISETGPDFADPRLATTQFESAPAAQVNSADSNQVESTPDTGFEWPGRIMLTFYAWFGICAIFAVRFTLLTWGMHFRLKRTSHEPSPGLSAIVAEVAVAIGLRGSPCVISTPAVASPAVFGLIRPKLLIPAAFETAFDEAEMRWAIAHELAHLKRRDLWAVAFERAVGLAGFFHPALWLARRATANFRELACDDVAGNVTGLPPRTCAETFLKILVWADRQPDHVPGSPLVLGMNPRYPAIRRRIENMTDQANSKRPARLGRISWAVLAFLAMILSLPVVPKLVAMGPAKAENSADAKNPEENRTEGIRLTLKDAGTGQPIAGAEVLSFTDLTRTIQNTEANGQVTVDFDPRRNDSFSLLIRHSGYIPLQKNWYRNMPQDYPPPDDLQLTLVRGKPVGGRVTDSEGKPIADAEVRVEFEMELDGVRMPSPFVMIRTDDDGRWTASCVDPKTEKVVIQVRHPQYVLGPRPYATGNRLVLRKPFQELVDRTHVIKMSPGHKFIATVLAPDGKPVEGARAYLNHLTGLLEDAGVASSAEGSLVVGNIGSLEGTPFQTIRVIVHKPGVGWHTVDLAESEFDRPMTVRLEPPRKFKLRVVDPDGKPIAGARIMSEFMPGDQSLRINEISDTNGIFETMEFPPGKWRMTAGKGGFHGKSVEVDAARKNDETLVLNREIVAEATVKDAVKGKPVESLRIFQVTGEAKGRSRVWFDKGQNPGQFRLTLDQPRKDVNDSDQKSRLRFEADGFEPFETEPFPVTKPPAKFEIALKPGTQGRFVTGKVLKPDGTPAAGAEVGFFTPSVEGVRDSAPRIENGRIESFVNRSNSFRRELTRTGADGSFRIPVESDLIGLVVTHESGGFRSSETSPVPQGPIELKLQPFGRIEGQLFVNGKVMGSKPLTYEYKFDDGPKESYVVIPFTVVSDEQGRFVVENIVPGHVRFRYAVPSANGQGGMGQFMGGAVTVAAGATTKIQADVNTFGLEEAVLDDAGNVISKHTVGSREPVFRVVGIATDADTGQPVTPVLARLATGLKGDDVSVHASSGTIRKGAFETGPFWSRKVDVSKEPVDAWLVVVANGYEPYVSPNRIPRQKGSVRIDVRLKKVDAAKMKTYTGMIRLADGSPAFDAKVSATVIDPGIDVGDSKFRWVLNENDTYETDKTGKFRIVAPREFETLFVSAGTGYAILKAADFLEEPGKNPEVKLTPWSRIEGRVTKGGKPSDWLEMRLSYEGIRLPSYQARASVNIDSDGTFAVTRAIAIPATLSVYSQSDWGRFVLEKKVTVESKPGETARVEVEVDATSQPQKKAETSGISKPLDVSKSAGSAKTADSINPAARPKPEFPAPSGKFITGKVLKPDGTPAAGAEVGFFTTTDDRNDRFLPRLTRQCRIEAIEHRAIVRGQWNNSEREPIRTDADGRFRLPVWAERFGWCVTHDEGVLRSTKLVEMAEGETELKLEPWGRIEGRLLLDERPRSETTVDYQPNFDIGKNPFVNPMPTIMRTDPEGRFVIERAMPGPYRFVYPNPASNHGGSWRLSDQDQIVPARGTLRLEVNQTMFGWEERLKDDTGKIVDRKTYGAMRPGFRVYGQVIDFDTGVPVEPMKALLVNGQKDEPLDVIADERPGSVFSLDFRMTRNGLNDLGEVDPYLVVIAPGYEPYVSAERIERGDSPVRHDVRLKKLPPEKTLTIEGQILDPDGKPPRLGFYRKIVHGETVKVGETTLVWKFSTENPPFAVDHGRFRFTAANVPGKLFFASQVGFAQVEAAEFAKLPGGVVRLKPWGKVRLRILRNGKPDGNFRITNDLRERWKLDFVPSDSWYPRDDGVFLLDRLPPMPIELYLTWRTSSGPSFVLKPVTIEAKPGETTDVDVVVTDEELKEAEAQMKARQASD